MSDPDGQESDLLEEGSNSDTIELGPEDVKRDSKKVIKPTEPIESAPGSNGWSYYIALLVIMLIGFGVWMAPEPGWRSDEYANTGQAGVGQTTKEPVEKLESTPTYIYLPDKQLSSLVQTVIQVDMPERLEGKIEGALEGLFKNKRAENLLFPNAAATRGAMATRGVYVYKSTAIVSLAGNFRKSYHTGAWIEFLAVQSIVNTICANFKQISRVRLLIDDLEEDLFAYHVDISNPIAFNPSIVTLVKQKPVSVEKKDVKKEIPPKAGSRRPKGDND